MVRISALKSLKYSVLYCLGIDRLMHWPSWAQTEATDTDRSFASPFLRRVQGRIPDKKQGAKKGRLIFTGIYYLRETILLKLVYNTPFPE